MIRFGRIIACLISIIWIQISSIFLCLFCFMFSWVYLILRFNFIFVNTSFFVVLFTYIFCITFISLVKRFTCRLSWLLRCFKCFINFLFDSLFFFIKNWFILLIFIFIWRSHHIINLLLHSLFSFFRHTFILIFIIRSLNIFICFLSFLFDIIFCWACHICNWTSCFFHSLLSLTCHISDLTSFFFNSLFRIPSFLFNDLFSISSSLLYLLFNLI